MVLTFINNNNLKLNLKKKNKNKNYIKQFPLIWEHNASTPKNIKIDITQKPITYANTNNFNRKLLEISVCLLELQKHSKLQQHEALLKHEKILLLLWLCICWWLLLLLFVLLLLFAGAT